MKRLVLVLLFLSVTGLWAQNHPTHQKVFELWQQKFGKCTNLNQLDSLLQIAENNYAQQPLALLQVYRAYSRQYYSVAYLVAQKKMGREDYRKIVKQRQKQHSKFLFKVAKIAATLDTIPDEDLRLFARGYQKAAQRLRFYQQLFAGQMPPFTFTDTQGREHKLEDFKGHYLLLFFWNRHSIPCMEEIPNLKKAHQMFPKKLIIVDIHLPQIKDPMNEEILRNLYKEMELDWLHVLGEQAQTFGKRFYVSNFPTVLFFDSSLKLLNDPWDMKGILRGEKLLNTLKEKIQ